MAPKNTSITPILPMTLSADFLTNAVCRLIKEKDLKALVELLPELTFRDAARIYAGDARFIEHEDGFLIEDVPNSNVYEFTAGASSK